MPGPPPKRNVRRRNVRPEWRRLPASGRKGAPPEFPLDEPNAAELAVWADLWHSPQAVAWESLGWTRVVARYARLLAQAEHPDASAALLGEVRQMEDRLGLSPMAMKRLQWEVDETATESDDGEADVARLDDYRARLG